MVLPLSHLLFSDGHFLPGKVDLELDDPRIVLIFLYSIAPASASLRVRGFVDPALSFFERDGLLCDLTCLILLLVSGRR